MIPAAQKVCKKHQGEFRARLRGLGEKATPARLAVLEALAHARLPVPASGILPRLGQGAVDPATVHRSLIFFKKLGWLRTFRFGRKALAYELASAPHRHHLFCESCGRVAGLPGCSVKILSEKTIKAQGFARVFGHTLAFFGTCESCRRHESL